MIRRPPRSTQSRSSAASDVYKRQPLHRQPQLLLYQATSFRCWKRRNAILQEDKLSDDIGRDQIRTGAQELTELDVSGSQLLQHLTDVATPRPDNPIRPDTPPDLEGFPKIVALKEIAEPMADRYFRDLTYALQVPHARKYTRRGATGRHRLSRQSKYQSVPLPGSTGVQSASNRNLDPLDPF